MAGKKPPITHEPQCGYFRRKMVRGGPWVPVEIYLKYSTDMDGDLVSPEVMVCNVNGKACDPEDQWTYVAGSPITLVEYEYLRRLSVWARTSDSNEPLADPRKKIDMMTTPIPVFKKKRKK